MAATPARADTMEAALLRAYQNNPQLNAQRASVRAIDENVPQALSGYRPKVTMTASGGGQYTNQLSVGRIGEGPQGPHAVGATVTQTLFNGDQTANKTRAAESQVLGAREGLRLLEQSVLLAAATIYMDYLRDAAILEVQRSNTRVLEETLKQTRQRYSAGLVTPTDVAQSEAQLAAGRSQELAAEANLTTTRANFRRIIGNEPDQLAPGSPVDRYLPETLRDAADLSLAENPNVTAAMYGIDVNFLNVKVNEGALFPTVTLQASVQKNWQQTITSVRQSSASAVAQVSVPIYQGGAEYSLIRQSKETLEQQRLNLEQVRDQARADLITAWGQLLAGKAQVASTQSQVSASEIALLGTRKEATVGQRTVLDVLNAQQAVVNARVALVTAQHDRVVASYAVLSAVGRLSPQVLHLATPGYDPSVHYHQVRDNWVGVRTPDGR
jgi:outer membrane protein